VIAPPGPGTPAAPGAAEALFAEARRLRLRRRRRLAVRVACLVLAGSLAAGLAAGWPGHRSTTYHHPRAAAAPDSGLPPVRVAWVDYGGQLHVGNLATRAQRVVATVDASPADPMIQAGGRLYWADAGRDVAPIRDYDIATGKIRYLASGSSVFAAADGRHIYIAATPARLIELPAGGTGRSRLLALPAGWQMSAGLGNWSVAGGIVVYSGSARQRAGSVTVAIWEPGTGRLKIIGRDLSIVATFTPPGARYSLLAWTAGCAQRCRLGITNTSTLATVTVPSPNRYGFSYGGIFSSGAFSPGGSRLAVFLNTTNPHDSGSLPYSVLAIVSTRTGTLRLVPAARLVTTEDVGWARWLPGTNRLIAGAEAGTYAVDAVTRAARPFSFSGFPSTDINSSGDINFSATLLPAR
jgi:hypothetical protein